MKIFDLSHPISESMPFYPGTQPPLITESSSIPQDGYMEKRVCILTHTGTHIDAPAHITPGAATIDAVKPDRFLGQAMVVNIPGSEKKIIDIEDLVPHRELMEKIDFILINTGWHRYWGQERYFKEFPVLTPKAAQWLCQFNLKGIGFDTISADASSSVEYPIHQIILGHQINIIENLNNLEYLPTGRFFFCCLPLLIQGADGSPVRAVAITD